MLSNWGLQLLEESAHVELAERSPGEPFLRGLRWLLQHAQSPALLSFLLVNVA